MRLLTLVLLGTLALAAPARADSELTKGFAGALRGCEEWILNPASWVDGVGPFLSTVGLGNKIAQVDKVEETTLPPPELRRGNHYWRINSTEGAGYILVVSDELPMCHITGGGNIDLQPVAEAVLASAEFASHWEQIGSGSNGEMASTSFRNRTDAALTIVITRARRPKQRLDRVQVLATATYALKQ